MIGHVSQLLLASLLGVLPLAPSVIAQDAADPIPGATSSDPVQTLVLTADEVPPVEVGLGLEYPGTRLSRTRIHWVVTLGPTAASQNPFGFYNLEIAGGVLRNGQTVDRFDYRFDLPAAEEDTPLAMIFDRDLRPGDYALELELEDLVAGQRYRGSGRLTVPALAPPPAPPAQAAAPPPGRLPGITLLRPDSPIVTGLHRFAAETRGEGIERVGFVLDGRPVLTKTRPPYDVELDLGDSAEVHVLEAEAWGAGDEPLARDRLTLNTGGERFAVTLASPEGGDAAGWTVHPAVEVPEGRSLTSLELWLGDREVAVAEQPPFDRSFPLPTVGETDVVRAVARLDDGRTAEATTLLNARGVLADLRVHLVELYTAVVDRRGQSVDGLAAGDFRVLEDGVPQRLAKLEKVSELPCNFALVLDVSSSMRRVIDEVGSAAASFFDTVMKSDDRASVIVFDDFPRVAVDPTSDRALLANALVGLRTRGGTALHDGLLFALRSFDGITGQRVVLFFSDGADKDSRVRPEEVLTYARRAGITIYTVGLDVPPSQHDARNLLRRVAEETGGRAFFLDDPAEAAGVYRRVEADMRSRYLLAYQSSNGGSGGDFRQVDVRVDRPEVEARTVRGYYP